MMVIRTFSEKVGDEVESTLCDGKNIYKVLKGQYEEQKERVCFFHNNGGWTSLQEFRKDAVKRHGFMSEENGVFRFSLQTSFGIKSYQEVSFSDDNWKKIEVAA